jgi:hypothetical protein
MYKLENSDLGRAGKNPEVERPKPEALMDM